ncbi:15087_t:CDS:2 [Funneliformis mosseae]|uniref:15087_t:CDS:1 n=1 Tax=Funneliformis mosseae TaxID=27381 RepID=A0A9N9BPY7_FUNMO|nr:15087_t:CDS:2 [Funneliformis mosseae]
MITDSLEQLSISEKKIIISDISDDTSNSDDIFTKEISPPNKSQPDKEEAITPDPITRIEYSSTQV